MGLVRTSGVFALIAKRKERTGELKMKLVLLGPPGAGKGTQAAAIIDTYHIPQISTGDILREAVSRGSKLGLEAKKFMDSGRLVPDEVVIGLIRERIKEKDCEKGFILDGFPRTIAQAEALAGFTGLDTVVNIAVPEDELVRRLTSRRSCKGCGAVFNLLFKPPKQEGTCDRCGGKLYLRDDDNEQTVRERLATYRNSTSPLIDFYDKKGILLTVDGSRKIDEIAVDILDKLTNL